MSVKTYHNQCPDYGLYAWPYFLSIIIMGIIGSILSISSPVLSMWGRYLGITLAIIGFYLASAHYIYMGLHFRRINEIEKLFSELDHQKNGALILDVGCGTGRATILAAKTFSTSRVVGIDIFSRRTLSKNTPQWANVNAQIASVENRVCFNYGDAHHLPFKDQCFDMVICASVLHITSPAGRERVISEIIRVLKNQSKFIMLEFLRTSKTLLVYWFPALWVFQHENYWRNFLINSGLRNIRMTRIGALAVFHSEKRNGGLFSDRALNY